LINLINEVECRTRKQPQEAHLHKTTNLFMNTKPVEVRS